MTNETPVGEAPRRPRLRRPRGRWLWLSVAVVVLAIGGTATGLVLSLGGSPAPRGSWPVTAAFSADGRYLVTAGLLDAQVIDPGSDRVLARWQIGHLASCDCLYLDAIGISRDDKTIVTVANGHVTRWSVAAVLAAGVDGKPRPLAAFQVLPKPGNTAETLSADGALLAIHDGASHFTVWSTVTDRVVARIPDVYGPLAYISPDDRVVGVLGHGLELWDISASPPRRVRVELGARKGAGFMLGFMPEFTPGDGVLTTRPGPDGSTRLLDDATGRQLAVVPNAAYVDRGLDTSDQDPVAYSPAAGLVALGNTLDESVTVWSVATGRVVAHLTHRYPRDALGSISSIAFSADGRTMVVLGPGDAWLWHPPAAVLGSARPTGGRTLGGGTIAERP